MEPDIEKITILTLKEIEGSLNEQEKEFLYEAIAEDAEAFRCWQSLHQSLGPEQLEEARASIQRQPIEDIIKAGNKRRRKAVIKKWFIAATLLLLTCSSLYLFLHKRQQPVDAYGIVLPEMSSNMLRKAPRKVPTF